MGRRPKITFHEFCPEPTDTSNPLCQILYYKFSDRADIIVKRFMAYTGLPLKWESISMMSLTKFRDCCHQDMSPNSVSTTCAWLSSAISVYARDNGHTYRSLCDVLNIRREKGSFVFITESDIDCLIDYYYSCHDEVLRAVAALAIVEFYTGARRSDTANLSLSNVEFYASYVDKLTGEIRYTEMVAYTSQKTKVRASVPLKPIVRTIFSDESIADVEISTNLFNTAIKKIVRESGMDRPVHERRAGQEIDTTLSECVSSHTFRRSFATNLYRKGVHIETICKMMGHTNTAQTMRYICGDTLVLDNKTINFFN